MNVNKGEISRREILRYLSAGDAPSEELHAQIERAISLAEAAVRPRSVSAVYPCEAGEDGVRVGGIRFAGSSLARNLRPCSRTFLLAVTLGAEADLLLRRETQRGAANAAVMQAVLTECIEQACNQAERELASSLAPGESLRPRFSLGYGDTLLADQASFFALLPVTKRLGVSLSDSFLMTPTKSVTAFVGICGASPQTVQKGSHA